MRPLSYYWPLARAKGLDANGNGLQAPDHDPHVFGLLALSADLVLAGKVTNAHDHQQQNLHDDRYLQLHRYV